MRRIIFALAFALVGSQQLHYEPSFSQSKTYVYQYEGVILTGLPEDGLAKGGLKITSKVQISSISQRNYLFKIISPQIQEYSGIWPVDQFNPARKLTKKLSAQLSRPITFEYSRGRVGNIYAPPDLPVTVLNLHRGILNTMQISIKKTQNTYDLQENGVEGICQASYVIQENKKTGLITVTKSKDLNNCQEKISVTKGSAYTQLCETCQLKGKSLRSVSTYTYALKSTEDGAEIFEVVSQETHQFTPFNELDGAASTESRQHLVLLERKNQSPPMPPDHLEKRGTLRYQFSNELLQMPLQLVKASPNATQIAELLENLVQINQERAHPDAPQRFLQLILLLRSTNSENLRIIWQRNAAKQNHRRWILDTLPTAATHETIQFIQTRIEQGDLTQGEAAQALIFVLHSIEADCHGVDNATVLLSSSYMQSNPFLRRVTLLAYGSLVQKYCTTVRVCPDEALQPLHELVIEAGSRGHEEETILGLKAIGNAGQPASLKRIQKLLPGFGNIASSVSSRIQGEAVMALRNIAKKEPRKVQALTVQLFMNKRNHVEVRMRAFIVLLETKPSMALIATVTDSLTRETNLHLTSFAYSYMKSLAGSSLPDLQSLAASCNIAVKRLNQKCDTLSYRYSKGLHLGAFKDKFLAGIAANFYLIKRSEGILPTSAVANFKVYGLGVSTDFLEIGIQAEGLQLALWKNSQPNRRGSRNIRNERIMGKVPGWKPIPTVKPLAVAYIKLFGQELAYVELNQNDIQEAVKLMSNQARRDSLIKKFINQLQRGLTTQWTKPLLATEIRHIVPTSLGLPLELAFYYTVVSAVAVKAKVKFTPVPTNFTMVQLLNTSIQTDVQLNPSSVKDVIAIMGINTPLIQTGVEVQLKTSTVVPVNLTARVNLKKSNIKIETPPLQQEDQLFSARSRAFAFSRNIEDLAAAKVTPLISKGEFGMMNRKLSLAKNSSADHKRVMDRVLPLAIPQGSVCSAEDTSDVPRPTVHQACVKSNTFGLEVCYKTSAENYVFATNSPLYKIIGEKSVEVAIKPVVTPIAIKKLQIELQLQAGDQPSAKVSHSMKKSNRSGTNFPEGKLALLKRKKVFQRNGQHQDRQELKYTMSSTTSSSQTTSRRSTGRTRKSNENKKEHMMNQHRNPPISRSRDTGRGNQHKHNKHDEQNKHGQHVPSRLSSSTQSKDEYYRRAQHERERPMSHQSISSSSSAQSKEHYGAHPHEGSSRKSSRHLYSSSSSSAQSRRKKGITRSSHHPTSTEKCKDGNCRNKQLSKHAHRLTNRNSSLSSIASLSRFSSISSSAQSGERPERVSSSSSSSSESSSSRSSSDQSKRRHGKHDRRGQSSSSSRAGTSSSSSSWHHKTVDVWPSTKRRTTTKRCKNGKCVREYTKSHSTTIHRYEMDHSTWIFDSKSVEQGTANANIFQLHFKPSFVNLSQNKARLSFESSSESSSESRMSFSSSSSSSSQQSLFLGDSVSPILSLLTRAITIDNKEKGYQTKVYVDNSMEQRTLQLFVDELQEGGGWRACIDAEMPNVHRGVAILKWGKNCQDYKIAAKATTGHFEHHPAVLVKMQWDKIPQSLKETAELVADQLAGVAFMLGFSERHHRNTPHRISVIAAATSQRTLDVVLKTPKHVFSSRALSIPVPLPFDVSSPSVHQRGLYVLTDLPAMVSGTSTDECTVVQNQFTPFNKNSFEYQMPDGCAHILVQDCTPELKFIALIRHSAESIFVQLNLPSSLIEIQSTATEKLQLFVNGTKMSIASLPSSLAIERIDDRLEVKAPEVGLEKLSFDGKEIKVSVMPWMAGSTCGLCGRSDSQGRDEYQQPNKQTTMEILKFAHSWLLPGENCKDACKLTKRTEKLEKTVNVDGQESKCYSIDQVLRCQLGCSPVKTVPVVYRFHCFPADSHMNPTDEQLISANFGQKSEDLAGTVEAHTACSCPSECS
ncbi:vitellogenin 3, phosvitinless [Heterodontus francisci]|uniref:vitellogenin 3, phosvitinless n=1 Tax=Heterodontus francisci TaxID=7792 RepID=UPI00355ACE56